MRVCRESKIVAGLCLADLISTLALIHGHGASEGNMIMRYYLQQGLGTFVGAKCFLFVPALLIAEWYRRRNPRLITGTLRLVIVLYVGLYSVGVIALNHRPHSSPPTARRAFEPEAAPGSAESPLPAALAAARLAH